MKLMLGMIPFKLCSTPSISMPTLSPSLRESAKGPLFFPKQFRISTADMNSKPKYRSLNKRSIQFLSDLEMASQPLTPLTATALRALMHDHPNVVQITTAPISGGANEDMAETTMNGDGGGEPAMTSVSVDLFSAMDADPDFGGELLAASEYDVEDVFRKALSGHPQGCNSM